MNRYDDVGPLEQLENQRAAAQPEEPRGHNYPGIVNGEFSHTSDCSNGCGCWMGGTRSGGPAGVDPFGACPNAQPEEESRG